MKKILLILLSYLVFWGLVGAILITNIVANKANAYEYSGGIKELNVPGTFTEGNWDKWVYLEYQIDHAKEQVIILNWQGRGGRISLGSKFINFLNHTRKTVVLKIVGGSYSMHALVVCQAHQVEFNQGFLMFHLRAEDGIPDRSYWSQRENSSFMNGCIAKGIVTREDINKVNQDQVLWVYPSGYKKFTNDTRR